MKIPYGRSDFGEIRRGGFFYADKTPFLPVLESDEAGYAYLLFLRPRRFGKSTLLSMLEHYYDLGRKDQFDALFQGLWIHEHPTPERNRYLVLSLDLSTLDTPRDPDTLSHNLCEALKGSLRTFFMRYRERIPELAAMADRLESYRDAVALMANVLGIIAGTEYKLYLLIDEYDRFANRLLASGSEDVYTSIVKDTGFVRSFFATLKAGTRTGAVGRMFITGVTPLMLDDLASGFNIASHVSQDPALNTLAGFTRGEVERAVDEFLAAHPELAGLPGLSSRVELLDTLERYYNGYRFSTGATERVFNSDMVLYFLAEVARRGRYPEDMLDPNVRTEYRHLQRIGALGSMALAERRALLSSILSEGHLRSNLVRQFGVASLPSRAPYISLLYYLGMLTLGAAPRDALGYDLEVPNRVIRELQWEHLALVLQEQAEVVVNSDELNAVLVAMGVQGDIQPFLALFHERVVKKLAVKDLRGFGEGHLKLMLMTYLSLSRMFHVLSEKEFAQGYCDLFLGASHSAVDARFSWLLELKYLPTQAKPAQVEAAFSEAEAQVARYASDPELLPLLLGHRELKAGMLVFVGAKKVLFRPWPAPTALPGKPPQARRKAAKKTPSRASGAGRGQRKRQ